MICDVGKRTWPGNAGFGWGVRIQKRCRSPLENVSLVVEGGGDGRAWLVGKAMMEIIIGPGKCNQHKKANGPKSGRYNGRLHPLPVDFRPVQPARTMKTQIDLKSAVLGLILGSTAMFTLGNSTSNREIGRYQVAAGQGTSIILDTATGQSWGYVPLSTREVRYDDNFWDVK